MLFESEVKIRGSWLTPREFGSCGLGFRTLERESHHSTLFRKQSLDDGDGMPARNSRATLRGRRESLLTLPDVPQFIQQIVDYLCPSEHNGTQPFLFSIPSMK